MVHNAAAIVSSSHWCQLHDFKHIQFNVKSVILALRVVACPAYPTVPPGDLDLLCSLDGHKQTKDKENQFEASVVNDPSLMVTACWTAGQMNAALQCCACCIDLCILKKKISHNWHFSLKI